MAPIVENNVFRSLARASILLAQVSEPDHPCAPPRPPAIVSQNQTVCGAQKFPPPLCLFGVVHVFTGRPPDELENVLEGPPVGPRILRVSPDQTYHLKERGEVQCLSCLTSSFFFGTWGSNLPCFSQLNFGKNLYILITKSDRRIPRQIY